MLSTVGDQAPEIERIARQALRSPVGAAHGETVLLLCHWPNGCRREDRPFRRISIFPFGRTKARIALPGPFPTAVLGAEGVWAAAAVRLPPRTRTGVLEILEGQGVLGSSGTTKRVLTHSRHAVLLAPRWQTRIFMRYDPRPSSERPATDATEEWIDLSMQMADPDADIVYNLDSELNETARNALERDRPVFVNPDMIEVLLGSNLRNPVTGLAGLHLFLQAIEQGRLTGANRVATARMDTRGKKPEQVAAEALANLAGLLGEGRDWEAPPDLLALRARAGLPGAGGRLLAPPMFWAGWNALKTSTGTAGHAWIGRDLWQSMGDALPRGPYMAWSPSRRSFQRRLERAQHFHRSVAEESAGYSDPLELASAMGVPQTVSVPPET